MPTALAWYALLDTLGFDAHRVIAVIDDKPFPDHLTVVVRFDSSEYVVDTVRLWDRPVLLSTQAEATIYPPMHEVLVEICGNYWRLRYHTPAQFKEETCLLLHWDADLAMAIDVYETTQAMDQFRRLNLANYTILNTPTEILTVAGSLVRRTALNGSICYVRGANIEQILITEVGYSPQIVRQFLNLSGSKS